ncbi:MAG: YigZ family protein [Bacteroidales bacterium]|nr:YigZ family protein [Bacteroidales bacterium]
MNSLPKSDTDSYLSIAAPSEGLYKEKGSKFMAFAYPVEEEEQAKEIIADLKKEYFDARHHCYAYRIGHTGDQWRMNDDGEPSSTAGRPIFGQLLSNELSDILVVVVRYFGGIKLGVPGLIRAYKSATADAIANAEIVEKIAGEFFTITFDYLQMNDVMKVLKEMNITPISQDFDLTCTMEVRVRLTQIEQFYESLKNIQICRKI